jgi:hypothetical protein
VLEFLLESVISASTSWPILPSDKAIEERSFVGSSGLTMSFYGRSDFPLTSRYDQIHTERQCQAVACVNFFLCAASLQTGFHHAKTPTLFKIWRPWGARDLSPAAVFAKRK